MQSRLWTARVICMGLMACVVGAVIRRAEAQGDPAYVGYDGRLSVRHAAPVSPDVIGVTIWAGKIVYGDQVPYEKKPGDEVKIEKQRRLVNRDGEMYGALVGKDGSVIYTRDRFTGDRIDLAWAEKPTSYAIRSSDDEAYATPVQPVLLNAKSKPIDLGRVGPKHFWQFDAPTETVVYLRLAEALSEGKSYTITFKGKELAPASFTYDPNTLRSEAVHVSHLGFHPDDPAKVAFLSCWMGAGGGLEYNVPIAFAVLTHQEGREVFRDRAKLSKAATDKTEDAYKRNFNETDVYIMDFSPVNQEGLYVVMVEGVGCSYPFRIHKDAWREAFTTSARGFYHQRSGIALGPPYTEFRRPRTFHPDDGVTVYQSTTPLMNSGNGLNYLDTDRNNFDMLVAGKTDRTVKDAWGGYMDAGDWDRRIQHLIVSRYLIELAELFPVFFDALSLNIPESNDGVADVVSEALFNLDCYRRMQTADGGIRGGIESSEHPRAGECSWQESLDIMVYAPGIWSSHWYAGVAARAALFLKARKPELARTYEQSALRAMVYAEKHWPELGEPKAKVNGVVDQRNMAALELYRLTGEALYHRIFLETTAFKDAEANLFKWPVHNQADAAWLYVRMADRDVDEAVRANCRAAILREANARVAQCSKTAFRWTKDPWKPASWGAFTLPDGISMIRAYLLTEDPKYLKAVILCCQHAGGANPLNMCYTTGIGPKYPLHPLHIDSRLTDQLPPSGITIEGPLGPKESKGQWGQTLAEPHIHPPFEKWPTTEAYWDIFWYPAMCEFTVQQPMAANAYVWGFLAARHTQMKHEQ